MIGFSSLLRALSLKLRIIVIGGGIAAILATYGLWHHKVFNSGWNAAIAAIAAQDMANEELLREHVAKLEAQMAHLAEKLDDTYKKIDEMHAICCRPRARGG